MVLKFLLLHLFWDHPAYPQFAGIEESISQADVDYDQASRHILDAYLWAVSSQAGASALLAGAGAPAPNKKSCWDCGAPGKVHGDGHNCPTPGSGLHDTHGHGNNKGKHGKSGGKAGGKSSSGHGLSKPCVVDPSNMPPRSDLSAHMAFCAQEYQACTAQAQQNAQQSAGSAPLPPESWAVPPPPPPVYGAPPSGAGQAQASYYVYQPQQQPVPDSQLLGAQSSPWGPQTPWEADAWGFMAEVYGVDEAFASVSGFGCGSGSGSPVNLWPESDSSAELEGHAVPLGTPDHPIDLRSDSSGEVDLRSDSCSSGESLVDF